MLLVRLYSVDSFLFLISLLLCFFATFFFFFFFSLYFFIFIYPARALAEEWAVREELAAAYRVFAHLGWTHLIHTHITVKVPSPDGDDNEYFLINQYGMLWEEITASSLNKVLANGNIVDGGNNPEPRINPAGFRIHSAIHTSPRGRKGGDVLCVATAERKNERERPGRMVLRKLTAACAHRWTMHTHTPEVVAVATTQGGLPRGSSQYAIGKLLHCSSSFCF